MQVNVENTVAQRKLLLYIACSIDGFIAKPDDDLSFLELVQIEGEDYGYSDFVAGVDTVVIGRKTYDWVLRQGIDFPHSDKKTYVITRQELPNRDNLVFYNGCVKELIKDLKSQKGKNIFCDGGAEIVNLLLKDKLIDEMIISIAPILLGAGTRLFAPSVPEQEWSLVACKSFSSGLVQVHYRKK